MSAVSFQKVSVCWNVERRYVPSLKSALLKARGAWPLFLSINRSYKPITNGPLVLRVKQILENTFWCLVGCQIHSGQNFSIITPRNSFWLSSFFVACLWKDPFFPYAIWIFFLFPKKKKKKKDLLYLDIGVLGFFPWSLSSPEEPIPPCVNQLYHFSVLIRHSAFRALFLNTLKGDAKLKETSGSGVEVVAYFWHDPLPWKIKVVGICRTFSIIYGWRPWKMWLFCPLFLGNHFWIVSLCSK